MVKHADAAQGPQDSRAPSRKNLMFVAHPAHRPAARNAMTLDFASATRKSSTVVIWADRLAATLNKSLKGREQDAPVSSI